MEGRSFRSHFPRLEGSLSAIRRTELLLRRVSPAGLVASVTLVCIVATLPLGIAWASKKVVDAVVLASTAPAFSQAAVSNVAFWVGVELLIVAAMVVGDRALGTLRELMAAKIGSHVALDLMKKAASEPLAKFENPAFHDRLSRLRQDATSRPLSLVHKSLQALRSLLTLIACGSLLFDYTPWLAIALLAAGIPACVIEGRFASAEQQRRSSRSPEARKLGYIEHLVCSDLHAKERILFELADLLVGRYQNLTDDLQTADARMSIRRTVWTCLCILAGTAIFYGCYLYVCIGAARGAISLGDMTMYAIAFRQGHTAFQNGISALSGAYEDNIHVRELFSFLDEKSDFRAAPHTTTSISNPTGEKGIRFENVFFQYPHSDIPVLRGMSFFIPRGKTVALVGKNGAGKTTIIKLITGLYRPTGGRIIIDGKDITLWSADALKKRVSAIFQDFSRYQFTLRDNVSFGSIEHSADEDRIRRAIRHGGAEEILRTADAGLETPLGRMFHQGTELSGGQWQSIALARAFMREEADTWILDEPTAALDAEAEQEVFQRFRAMSARRTVILISHRMASARLADDIIVIEDGRVVERGQHEELLNQKGRYAQLFHLQATAYA